MQINPDIINSDVIFALIASGGGTILAAGLACLFVYMSNLWDKLNKKDKDGVE